MADKLLNPEDIVLWDEQKQTIIVIFQ
jgi:hypothetical protein